MTDLPAASGSSRVIACVIRQGHGYLMCRRPSHKRHGGLWEFPGGKTEPNESDESAAARELREELGVELTKAEPPIFEARDPESPYVIAFVPVAVRGELKCIEHSAVVCGSPAELLALPLAPADRVFLEFLMCRNVTTIDA